MTRGEGGEGKGKTGEGRAERRDKGRGVIRGEDGGGGKAKQGEERNEEWGMTRRVKRE